MAICSGDPRAGLVTGLIGTVDCYIGDFAQGAYRDLVGPGTVFAGVFTGLLTIYIALMGYQLLLGRGGLRLTDLPVTALKVGLILAFVTSWAAYQTLVYNVLFDGPQQIARVLLAQADRLGGTFGGDVFSGLEKSFYDLTNVAAVYGKQAGGNVNILQGGPALGAGLLWISAVAMLLSSVGLLLACKIVLGFLLALGPLFIGLFLFDATRGLFDGWLRTTIAFALTPLATTVLAAAMLLMLAPSIARLKQVANAERFDMGPVVTIAIIVAVFGLVMLQVVRLGYGIAGGFRSWRRSDARPSQTAAAAPPYSPLLFMENRPVRDVTALHKSERFSSQSMRGARENRSGFESGESRRIIEIAHSVSDKPAAPPPRLGEAYRRVPLPGIRRGEAY